MTSSHCPPLATAPSKDGLEGGQRQLGGLSGQRQAQRALHSGAVKEETNDYPLLPWPPPRVLVRSYRSRPKRSQRALRKVPESTHVPHTSRLHRGMPSSCSSAGSNRPAPQPSCHHSASKNQATGSDCLYKTRIKEVIISRIAPVTPGRPHPEGRRLAQQGESRTNDQERGRYLHRAV